MGFNSGFKGLIILYSYRKLLTFRITAFLSAIAYLPPFAVELQGCVLAVPAVSLI